MDNIVIIIGLILGILFVSGFIIHLHLEHNEFIENQEERKELCFEAGYGGYYNHYDKFICNGPIFDHHLKY